MQPAQLPCVFDRYLLCYLSPVTMLTMQGHEEFDDEITLAGSGRVTPYGEAPHQHSQGISPEGTATSPKSTQEGNTEANQEKSPQESQL